MATEWTRTTIGEFLARYGGEIKTGPFGTRLKASEYSEMGAPVISVGEIQLGRLVLHDRTPRVPQEITLKMPEYLLREGDIVFGRKGAVERSAIVSGDQSGWFLGSDGIRLRLPDSCDKRFVAYYLQSESHKKWMVQNSAGTTMASLNEKIIKLIPITLPPVQIQKRISDKLLAIDRKIDLNTQLNQTLESMAQALFKSWFVDFDPVIDNAIAAGNPIPEPFQAQAERRRLRLHEPVPEGQSPLQPLPAELRQLFPNSFHETEELGWVPEGWFSRPFGSIIETAIGGDWGKDVEDEVHTEKVKIIRGTDIPNLQSGSCGATPTRWIESKKYKTRQLRDGDIVIEVSGGSPTQSTGRSMYITNGILQRLGGMVAPASFCRKFVPASSELGLLAGVVLTFLYKKGRMWEYQNQSTGISNFQTNTFLSNEFLVIPTADVLKIFYRKIRPLIDRTHSNENIQLSEIRDLLLPKLLSGQLRIPDAEAQFAEAGL